MAIILVVLTSAFAAFARLAALGLLNPPNGFPIYYVDANGIALEMTAPPFGTPVGGPITAPTMAFDAPVTGNTFSQMIGFGTEAIVVSAGKGLSFARDIPLPTKVDFTTALGGDVGLS